MFVIRIDQGDYFQERGGFDWGRSEFSEATHYESEQEALDAIRRFGLASVNGRVEHV